MTDFPVPLDNLITYVKALRPDAGPLEHVSYAFAVSNQLDEQADALIGHFVDQARKSGLPWSQIGAAMGVSKQAAQKRFVPGKDDGLFPSDVAKPLSRFTDRAVRVLVSANRLASGTASAETGNPERPPTSAAHLAAALLAEPEGLAAKAVAAAGLSPEQVYAALGAGPAPQVANAESVEQLRKDGILNVDLDEDAKTALRDSLRWALRLGHNYIGTEHLMLGLCYAGGSASDAFTSLGLPPQRAEQFVTAEIAAARARRAAN